MTKLVFALLINHASYILLMVTQKLITLHSHVRELREKERVGERKRERRGKIERGGNQGDGQKKRVGEAKEKERAREREELIMRGRITRVI